jgi:Protein of unknown function (DUF3575)
LFYLQIAFIIVQFYKSNFLTKNLFFMKVKQLLITAIAILTMSMSINAQSYIKINPVSLAFGYIGVDYEKVVSDKNSFQVGAGFISRGILGTSYTGFGVNGSYRFYISKDDAPKGLFVSPTVGANFVSFKYDGGLIGVPSTTSSSYTTIGIGGLVGYQWLFSDDQFSFELGVGPQYGIVIGTASSDAFGTGIGPQVSLSVGYRLSGGK